MDEFEFALMDRVGVIRDTINKYGESNFAISYSGGKDSCVLSALVDMAIPNNRIPRVRVNTGVEFLKMNQFVSDQMKKDDRIITIYPQGSFKEMLEKNGYPVKSKLFARCFNIFQRKGYTKSVEFILTRRNEKISDKLKPMFRDGFKDFIISDKCCLLRKEKPLNEWMKKNAKTIMIVGLVGGEGGRRDMHQSCFVSYGKKRKHFYPLRKVNPQWVDEFVRRYHIELCDLYHHPYNFKRTGCKGCPFNPQLGKELKVLEELCPIERKQCELIFGKVYDLYRSLDYRLKGVKE